MTRPKIVFYFDIVSPFAYIAFHILRKSPVFKSCHVTYVPIHLPSLMRRTDNRTPAVIKNKFEYMDKERLRWAKRFAIPIADKFPAGFPLKTVAAQRVLVALAMSHPQCFERAIACYFDHFWGEYREPNKPENLLAILCTAVGSEEEARGIVGYSEEEEIRNKLAENTDHAFEEGAFGLSWFTATNATGETEGFWGVDRMGEMCDFLQLERPHEKVWRASL